VPAAAHAATSALPYFAYGPTVVHATRVRRASCASCAASSASATMIGASIPSAASLSRSRPAIAHANF
jgi:hypothetical protein